MASASANLCQECDRGSYRCDGCRELFCDYHFSIHRQDLTQRFNYLTIQYSSLKDILALPPSDESLTENTDTINKINQWEIDTIRQVKEIAEETREKLRRQSDNVLPQRVRTEFQQLAEQLQQCQRINDITESNIEQLTTKFDNLKLQIDDSLLSTNDIRITSIDWTKYLQIIKKRHKPRQNVQNIHFDRLLTTKPRISLDVKGGDSYVLGTASPLYSTFLYYQQTKKHKRLSIINIDGQQKSIPWYDDQAIWDSCWSSFLNKFIILADKRLYTYNDEISTSDSIQLIEKVRPKRDEMEFLRCTCSDETIYISYDERNSSIDEYNLIQWTIVHQYDNIVKQNEIIISMVISETNSNLIGLTILDDRQYWHFELRDRSMLLISSIQLDKSEFTRQLMSLSNSSMNWLIVHTGSKTLTVFDENVETKKLIECAENIDSATYITTKNCFIVLTQKNKLKFFDL